jgi:hypothetical protein
MYCLEVAVTKESLLVFDDMMMQANKSPEPTADAASGLQLSVLVRHD